MKDTNYQYMLEEKIMAVLFTLLLFFGGINIPLRYIFNTSIPFISDMMVDLFVWLSIIGLPVACYRGANMSLTILFDLLPLKYQKACIVLSCVLSIMLFVWMGYTGMTKIMREIQFDHRTAVPFIRRWMWSTAIPVCALLYITRVIQFTNKTLKRHAKVDRMEELLSEAGLTKE